MEVTNDGVVRRMDAPLELWVGDLSEYVSEKLDGEWISLPQSEENLQRFLDKVSKNGEHEVFIADYNCRNDCAYLEEVVGEYSNIPDLNIIAQLIGDEMHNKVEYYVLSSKTSLTPLELANALMQKDEIPFYEYEFPNSDNASVMARLSNEEKMGNTLLEQSNLRPQLENLNVAGAVLLDYINVEAIGRDYAMSGYVDLYDDGYIDSQAEGIDLNYYTMEEIKEELNGEDTPHLEEGENVSDISEEEAQALEKRPTHPDPVIRQPRM